MSSPAPLTLDEQEKHHVLNRLRRLEEQIRGLHKTVDGERPRQDILTLLSGIRSALDATGEVMFEQYLLSCAANEGEPLPTREIVKTVSLLR